MKGKIRKQKKGQLEMIPWFLVVLLGFGFVSYFAFVIFADINPALKDHLGDDSDGIVDSTNDYVNSLGGIFYIMLAGCVLFVIIAGVMRESHPVMFVASLLVLVIMVSVGAILGDAFEKFDSKSQMSDASNQYSGMRDILKQIPILVLVLVIVGAIVLYVRFKG